jgi:hypothetical protein
MLSVAERRFIESSGQKSRNVRDVKGMRDVSLLIKNLMPFIALMSFMFLHFRQ